MCRQLGLLRLAKPFFERDSILSRANCRTKRPIHLGRNEHLCAAAAESGTMQLTHQEARIPARFAVKCEPGGDLDFLFFHPFNERA